MANITTRQTAGTGATVAGVPLTNTQLDNNFISLNVGKEELQALGVPRSNLGNPTVREAALFDSQFNNKTERYDINNIFIESSTDNVNWSAFSISDSQKRILFGGDTSNSSLTIPYGTPYFRIRIRANTYVYIDALYAYWSSNGHNSTVQIFKKHDSGSWVQHTNSGATVSAWPGHLYLPFSTIPWHSSGTLGTHYHEIYVLFTPNWNASFPSNGIGLQKIQWWGGYPAGRRNVYSTDENGNVSFPAQISASTTSTNIIKQPQGAVAGNTSTVGLDFSQYGNFYVTLSTNVTFTFDNLTNQTGSSGYIFLKQDATGGRTITLPSVAKTPGGRALAQITAANSLSVITYYVVDTNTVIVNYIADFK